MRILPLKQFLLIYPLNLHAFHDLFDLVIPHLPHLLSAWDAGKPKDLFQLLERGLPLEHRSAHHHFC